MRCGSALVGAADPDDGSGGSLRGFPVVSPFVEDRDLGAAGFPARLAGATLRDKPEALARGAAPSLALRVCVWMKRWSFGSGFVGIFCSTWTNMSLAPGRSCPTTR